MQTGTKITLATIAIGAGVGAAIGWFRSEPSIDEMLLAASGNESSWDTVRPPKPNRMQRLYRLPLAIGMTGLLKGIEWWTEPGMTEQTALSLPPFWDFVQETLDEWDDPKQATIADDVPSYEAMRNTVFSYSGGTLHQAVARMLGGH